MATDMNDPAYLQQCITDAEAFRTSLRGRTDDAAHYWRCHLATRIYELRRALFAARETRRELVSA